MIIKFNLRVNKVLEKYLLLRKIIVCYHSFLLFTYTHTHTHIHTRTHVRTHTETMISYLIINLPNIYESMKIVYKLRNSVSSEIQIRKFG